MLLALDTSTAWLGVALHGSDGLVSASAQRAAMQQTIHCVAEVEHALGRAGVRPEALAGIAVALGPGGFTSLRVGLSVAKGLALALDRPLVGIGSLPAMIAPYRSAALGRTLGAVISLGRGELVAQWYIEPDFSPVEEFLLGGCAAIAEAAPVGNLVLVAEITSQERAELASALGTRVTWLEHAPALTRIAGVAALGWRRLAAGDVDDPAALEPLYPRRSGQPAYVVR